MCTKRRGRQDYYNSTPPKTNEKVQKYELMNFIYYYNEFSY